MDIIIKLMAHLKIRKIGGGHSPLMFPLEHAIHKLWESPPLNDTLNPCVLLKIMPPINIPATSIRDIMISNKIWGPLVVSCGAWRYQ